MEKRRSLFREICQYPYGSCNHIRLSNVAKRSPWLVQRLQLHRKLHVHNGCVNTICWNASGSLLLSGSDDQRLVICDPFSGLVQHSIHSGHRANIFSARFLPNTNDTQIISCSGDGIIFHTDVNDPATYTGGSGGGGGGGEDMHQFDCHFGTVYEVETVPQDPYTFLSCGEDGTVRWFDLRIKTACCKEDCKEDILINCRRAVTALTVHPVLPWQLAVGCSDSTVRIYDRRMLGTRATGNYRSRSSEGIVSRFTAPSLEGKSHRITSIAYRSDGVELLASYSSDAVYLFNLQGGDEQKPTCLDTKPKESKPETSTPGTSKDSTAPVPGTSSSSTSQPSPTTSPNKGKPPPIKRLRLRGDWSDTGPNARPERERATGQPAEGEREGGEAAAEQAEEETVASTLMQRMSDMLTRWLESTGRTPQGQTEGQGQSQPQGQGQAREGEGSPQQRVEATTSRPRPSSNRMSTTEQLFGDVSSSSDSDNNDEDNNRTPGVRPAEDVVRPPQGVEMQLESPMEVSSPTECTIPDMVETRSVEQDSSSNRTDDDEVGTDKTTETNTRTSEQGASASPQSQSNPPVDSVSDPDSSDSKVSETAGDNISSARPQEASSIGASRLQSPGYAPQSAPFSSPDRPQPPSRSQSQPPAQMPTVDASPSTSDVSPLALFGSNLLSISQSLNPLSQSHPIISLTYRSEGTCTSDIQVSYSGLPREPEGAGPSNVLPPGGGHINDRVAPPPAFQQQLSDEQTTSEPVATGLTTTTTTTTAELEPGPSDAKTKQPLSAAVEKLSEMHVSAEDDDEDDVDPEGASQKGSKRNHSESSELNRADSDSDSEGAGPRGGDEEAGVQTAAVAGPSPSTTVENIRTRPSLLPRRGSTGSAAVSASGAATAPAQRQRRIGHSGPPTGNFQLYSDNNSSDDDSDDDVELMRVARSARQARFNPREPTPPLDRNAAAVRLQKLYRKRQEERHKEEEELLHLPRPPVTNVFRGHRNARTMIKEANFFGDEFIMSGSDCGHIFIWDRETADLCMMLEADRHVVNCVQPHPHEPILASSGIDYNIKIWSPTAEQPGYDEEKVAEIVRRNEIMLEETRDTITVPASFMLRMLASLNHFRTDEDADEV